MDTFVNITDIILLPVWWQPLAFCIIVVAIEFLKIDMIAILVCRLVCYVVASCRFAL